MKSFYPLHPFILLAGIIYIIALIPRFFIDEFYISRGYFPVVVNICIVLYIIGLVLTIRRIIKDKKTNKK